MKDIKQSENANKFEHPTRTAKDEERAWVSLERLETLWLECYVSANLSAFYCDAF